MRTEDIERSQEYFTSTVALVTAKNGEVTNVMSAEWSLRVSLDPFLMAVFVGYERGTYDLIRESGEYGLSYCSDQQGKKTGQNIEGVFWSVAGGKEYFEGRVIDEFKVGDHAAFIGEVLTAYYDDSNPSPRTLTAIFSFSRKRL